MRNIKGFANASPFLGGGKCTDLTKAAREIIFVHKSWNYINLEGNRLWNPINLCSGFQTMFSFHPSPLPTTLRHQVWDLRITTTILAKVTKLQLMAFGSRMFQQTSVCWTITTSLHPALPLPQKKGSGKSHYFIILKKYLSKMPKERNDFMHLTDEERSIEIIYNSKWDHDISKEEEYWQVMLIFWKLLGEFRKQLESLSE